MNFDSAKLLTFDCYGTLIDWETGILRALQPLLSRRGVQLPDDELLETFARLEEPEERGEYQPYRQILRKVSQGLDEKLELKLEPDELDILPNSLGTWPPFPDTTQALRRLRTRFKLAVLSNVDDDLFRESQRLLECTFDWVITAETVRSYKPALGHFRRILEVAGLPPEKIIHVGQSLYHDATPAATLGVPFIWVNRRGGKPGFGATVPATAHPELEVRTLAELADLAGV